MYGKLLDRNRKLVENRLDDMLKAQRHAVDRIVHRYHRLGAVLLDPDVGDAELRVFLKVRDEMTPPCFVTLQRRRRPAKPWSERRWRVLKAGGGGGRHAPRSHPCAMAS